MQNVVHEALECLGGFAQAEGNEVELEETEWGGNGGLLFIVGIDGDLIVSSHQVDLGEDGTTKKLVAVVMDKRSWMVRTLVLCSCCVDANHCTWA
jgi:hypothetical protein